jgi:uncharacterized membrane protein YdbT with pleckstrin-like domain
MNQLTPAGSKNESFQANDNRSKENLFSEEWAEGADRIDTLLIRKSLFVMFSRLIALELLIILIYLLIRVALNRFDIFAWIGMSSEPFIFALTILVVFLELFVAVYVILQWANHYYILTPMGIKYRTGILFKKEKEYSLINIQSVSYHQGMFARLFNYGDIIIFSPALQGELHLTAVSSPQLLAELIKSAHAGKSRLGFVLRK